jgi:hypothetical protein
MKELIHSPTWLLTRALTPFLPLDHPWRYRHFTLANWAAGATPLCRDLSLCIWVSLITLLLMILIILS